MRRSTQEITELVVFALIAILVGTLLLWGVGWVFTGVGWVFRLIAGFIWSLLRFIIPIAIVGGVIFLVVKLLAQPKSGKPAVPSASATGAPAPPVVPVAPAAPAPVREPTAPAPGAGASPAPVVAVPPATPSEPEPDAPPILSTDDVLADASTDARTDTPTSTPASPWTDPSADAPAAPEEERVDPAVDTSGFKEMDDLAEEIAEDLEAAQEDADDARAERDPEGSRPDDPRPG
jgi:predicted lipid-binding transport protein (Tim44 family)